MAFPLALSILPRTCEREGTVFSDGFWAYADTLHRQENPTKAATDILFFTIRLQPKGFWDHVTTIDTQKHPSKRGVSVVLRVYKNSGLRQFALPTAEPPHAQSHHEQHTEHQQNTRLATVNPRHQPRSVIRAKVAEIHPHRHRNHRSQSIHD